MVRGEGREVGLGVEDRRRDGGGAGGGGLGGREEEVDKDGAVDVEGERRGWTGGSGRREEVRAVLVDPS